LFWIALLYSKTKLPLTATTSVQSATQVIKYLLAGAHEAMIASSLYKNGIPYLKTKNMDLNEWMYKMGFDEISSFKGSMSQQNISDPTAYERANYINPHCS
jgi:dihydroorotate dehydrogenase (fumarate)